MCVTLAHQRIISLWKCMVCLSCQLQTFMLRRVLRNYSIDPWVQKVAITMYVPHRSALISRNLDVMKKGYVRHLVKRCQGNCALKSIRIHLNPFEKTGFFSSCTTSPFTHAWLKRFQMIHCSNVFTQPPSIAPLFTRETIVLYRSWHHKNVIKTNGIFSVCAKIAHQWIHYS